MKKTGFNPAEFGRAAADYAHFRKGFPDSFFARMRSEGLGLAGQRVLDLGTGTGFLGRGFARQGAHVTGLDLSLPLMREARALDAAGGLPSLYVAGRAEAPPFREGIFDTVCAGQCWHWFDGPAAARQAARMLRPQGALLIANFDYLPLGDNASALTEELILRFNPQWPMKGDISDRVFGWRSHLEEASFGGFGTLRYTEDIVYSQEAWRGRVRACNGVLALGEPERIAQFDSELAALLLERYGEAEMVIPHKVAAIWGRKG